MAMTLAAYSPYLKYNFPAMANFYLSFEKYSKSFVNLKLVKLHGAIFQWFSNLIAIKRGSVLKILVSSANNIQLNMGAALMRSLI